MGRGEETNRVCTAGDLSLQLEDSIPFHVRKGGRWIAETLPEDIASVREVQCLQKTHVDEDETLRRKIPERETEEIRIALIERPEIRDPESVRLEGRELRDLLQGDDTGFHDPTRLIRRIDPRGDRGDRGSGRDDQEPIDRFRALVLEAESHVGVGGRDVELHGHRRTSTEGERGNPWDGWTEGQDRGKDEEKDGRDMDRGERWDDGMMGCGGGGGANPGIQTHVHERHLESVVRLIMLTVPNRRTDDFTITNCILWDDERDPRIPKAFRIWDQELAFSPAGEDRGGGMDEQMDGCTGGWMDGWMD